MFPYQKCGEHSRTGRCGAIFLHDSFTLVYVHFKRLFSTVLCHFKNSHRTIKIGGRTIFVLHGCEMWCSTMSCYIPWYGPPWPWAPLPLPACPALACI